MAPVNPATDAGSLADAVLKLVKPELVKPRNPAAPAHVAPRDLPGSVHADKQARSIAGEADATLMVPTPATRFARTPIVERDDTVVTTTTIPSFYGSLHGGPDSGTVVGITLGAVAGFLALLWLLYTCCSLGGYYSGSLTAESIVETETSVRRKGRFGGGGSDISSHHHHRRHRSTSRTRAHRSSGGSMSEVRRSSRPRSSTLVVEETTTSRRGPGGVLIEEVVTGPGRHRVVREEQRRRSVSRGGTRVVEVVPDNSTVVSSSTTTATTATSAVGYTTGGPGPRGRAEEIVVIEQEPRGGGGRRESFTRMSTSKGGMRVERSAERRRSSGAYRDIDPELYAGGNSPGIEVRRSRSRRRSDAYRG